MTTPSSAEYVRQGQEAFTRVAGALTETWASALRGAPEGGSGAFPSPVEVVDRSFDLGVQILEAQRAFAHGLLDATAPALRAVGFPAGR